MRIPSALIVVALVALPLAGCVGGGGQGPPTAGPTSTDNATPATEAATEQAPAERPHVHDRWDGAERKVLLDDEIDLPAVTDVDPEDPFATVERVFCTEQRFGLAEGSIVPPGTERLTITPTWESTDPQNVDTVDIEYMPANDNEWNQEERLEPGQTVEIPVTVKMADGGHADVSLWRFRLQHCAESPEHFTGMSVHLETVAHRQDGPLPVEPPHPDWWANRTERLVLHDEGESNTVGGAYVEIGVDGTSGTYAEGDDHGVIPPGTQLLVAHANWTNDSPAAQASDDVPELRWTHLPGWGTWHDWEPAEKEEGSWTYTLELTEEMTDSMYANQSRWRFAFEIEGDHVVGNVGPFGGPSGPYHFQGSWELTIRAYDDVTAYDPAG